MLRRALLAGLVVVTASGALVLPGPAGADSRTFTGTLPARGTAQHSFSSGVGRIDLSISCTPRARLYVEVLGGSGGVYQGNVNCRNAATVNATANVAGTYTVVLTDRGSSSTTYTLRVTTPDVVSTTTTTTAPAPTPTTTAPTTTTTAPTTTTTAPPTSPPAPTCTGVEVRSGSSIQAAIDANAPGTVFCIRAGTYRVTSPVVPKSNMQLIGEPGSVVTGGDAVSVGIKGWGTGATGVVVKGLVVERFTGDGIQASTGWVVESSELRYNGQSGLKPGDVTRNNRIHHNGRYGISGGYGSDGSVISGNEIAFNNTANHDWWDAGATKFITTRNLKVLNNHVHDNNGPGLWTDGNNIYTTFDGNRVENNAGSGIIHEISYDAVIRNNTISGNGFSDPYSMGGAGISVSTSLNTEIYGNTVSNNKQGILLVQQGERGAGSYGTYQAKNNYVHDNDIRMSRGFTGVHHYGITDAGPLYSTWNNRFESNTYSVSNLLGRWWQWANVERTRLEWQGLGLDLFGEFLQL